MATYYIRHTDQRLNPATGKGSDYFTGNHGQMIYVIVKDGGKTPVAYSSYGEWGHTVGQSMNMASDATGRNMGWYRIIGIRHADGSIDGCVPNRALRHGVAK